MMFYLHACVCIITCLVPIEVERQIPQNWRYRHLLGIEPESSLRASGMLFTAEPFRQPLFLLFVT